MWRAAMRLQTITGRRCTWLTEACWLKAEFSYNSKGQDDWEGEVAEDQQEESIQSSAPSLPSENPYVFPQTREPDEVSRLRTYSGCVFISG